MRRGEFILAFAAAALAPVSAWAQSRRIGVLVGFAETDAPAQARIARFRDEPAQIGWKDGGNVELVYRWASGDRKAMQKHAAELVALQPDVIFGVTVSAVRALIDATLTIPIVFAQVSDPVGSGLVDNVAHPGRNVTGFTNFEETIAGKWPELLKEIAPATRRIAILFNPDTAAGHGDFYLAPFRAAATPLAFEARPAPVHDENEIRQTLAMLAGANRDGLIVMPDAFTLVHRDLIISLAAANSLPTIYPFRFFASAGGLMSYGVDPMDQYPRAAHYVDRILRGARPAELPVQAPTKFELVVNLKTARSLGLDPSPTLLARADEVIE
ncbi:MAG TPA: ABC transporter substrate-binding protein [Xanthobacteraceae bacterium]|nr:ABC transporter substrate-binding protein [Xanthobacteraceae bacterium]